jgi:hypothetical protein
MKPLVQKPLAKDEGQWGLGCRDGDGDGTMKAADERS